MFELSLGPQVEVVVGGEGEGEKLDNTTNRWWAVKKEGRGCLLRLRSCEGGVLAIHSTLDC